ncbi:GspH/FimT family pseudopilin [Pseudomonas sp. NPDC089734]|uniref:GspH/FimT family pseudopilin n=1 Tax=Pseudomonas sp. NPDC089734 TaxID=3364469 RepID=UPI00381E52C4
MKHAGFTLVELLIVIALVAILANVASPPFSDLIDANRRLTAAQELASGIRSARAAAIMHSQVVTIHALEGDWSKGWRIIIDPKGNGPSEDDTLLIERAIDGKARIIGNSKVAEYLSFSSLGGLKKAANGTFHVCIRDQPVSHYRVIVAITGRVRVVDAKVTTDACS